MKISMYEWSRVKLHLTTNELKKSKKNCSELCEKAVLPNFTDLICFVHIIFYEYERNSDPLPCASMCQHPVPKFLRDLRL